MTKYAVVIEWDGESYSAFVPDLPGCISVGDTREDVVQNLREAIVLHLDGLRAHGDPVPQPTTTVDYVDVDPG